MSKNTTNEPITVADPQVDATESSEDKPKFTARAKTFVKNHKKISIAAGALVGLVAVSALTGKKGKPEEIPVTVEQEDGSDDWTVVETEDTVA